MSAAPSAAEPRFSEFYCAVCRRPATGVGVTHKPRSEADVAWLCDDRECIDIAERTYTMKQLEFRRLDILATQDGGDAGGAYLDKIGKSDLASLSQDEWQTFLEAVVGGYRAALKGRLANEAPF